MWRYSISSARSPLIRPFVTVRLLRKSPRSTRAEPALPPHARPLPWTAPVLPDQPAPVDTDPLGPCALVLTPAFPATPAVPPPLLPALRADAASTAPMLSAAAAAVIIIAPRNDITSSSIGVGDGGQLAGPREVACVAEERVLTRCVMRYRPWSCCRKMNQSSVASCYRLLPSRAVEGHDDQQVRVAVRSRGPASMGTK